MNRVIDVFNLGRMDYSKCLQLQKSLVEANLARLRDEPAATLTNKLLLVEHSPVYTVGLRRQAYAPDQLDKLKALGAQVELTDRGGLITFHGPGQLVAYPVFYLKNFNPSVKWSGSCLHRSHKNKNNIFLITFSGSFYLSRTFLF